MVLAYLILKPAQMHRRISSLWRFSSSTVEFFFGFVTLHQEMLLQVETKRFQSLLLDRECDTAMYSYALRRMIDETFVTSTPVIVILTEDFGL